MKTFRRPFRKSNTVFEVKIFTTVFFLFGIVIIPNFEFTILGFLFLITIFLIMMHIFISQLYYVILSNDKLIIQNGVYPFWRKEVRYVDIVKVIMKWYGGRSYPCIKVITEKPSGISWRYTIDLVAPRDYIDIVDAIKAKGVVIETKDLNIYANMFKDEN